MESISQFLEKFKKIKNPLEQKQAVARIMTEITTFEVSVEDFVIKSGTIFLQTNAYLRNEVYQKKHLILAKLKEDLKGLVIKDIK